MSFCVQILFIVDYIISQLKETKYFSCIWIAVRYVSYTPHRREVGLNDKFHLNLLSYAGLYMAFCIVSQKKVTQFWINITQNLS